MEGKKSTWLLVGYVVVLAFMFVAFEWTQRDVKIDTSQAVADVVFEEEIIPITETPEQAAPPPPEAPKVAELLEIVDDKAEIEETTTIINEDNQARVEVKYVPVQVVEEEPEEQTIFEVVENMPDFPGGQAALMQYLAKILNIRLSHRKTELKDVLSYSSLLIRTVVSWMRRLYVALTRIWIKKPSV